VKLSRRPSSAIVDPLRLSHWTRWSRTRLAAENLFLRKQLAITHATGQRVRPCQPAIYARVSRLNRAVSRSPNHTILLPCRFIDCRGREFCRRPDQRLAPTLYLPQCRRRAHVEMPALRCVTASSALQRHVPVAADDLVVVPADHAFQGVDKASSLRVEPNGSPTNNDPHPRHNRSIGFCTESIRGAHPSSDGFPAA